MTARDGLWAKNCDTIEQSRRLKYPPKAHLWSVCMSKYEQVGASRVGIKITDIVAQRGGEGRGVVMTGT